MTLILTFIKNYFFGKKKIKFKIDNEVITAKINKVLLNGLIELKLNNGKIRQFYPKQIKMIY